MSLRIMHNYQCSNCKAFYIPYEEGIVCPNCGLNEDEIYDIVSLLAQSAQYQMDMHGFYTPIAWWTGSLSDHVSLLIFQVLDAFDSDDRDSFEEFAKEYFDKVKLGSRLYMKDHICDLSYKVYLKLIIDCKLQQRI